MFNRQFNIKKDFSSLNELENEIYPKIRNATFKSVEDKKQIIDYIHKIFNNQYRKRGSMIDLLEHVKPNKDCNMCDTYDTGYACISCEGDQVKEKYPNATLNNECIWELKESEEV